MTMNILTKEERETRGNSEPSKYLKYLPAFYSEDEFLGRFLKIFESIITPIEQVIGQIDIYFDPKTTTEGLLPWLASWVDLVLDEGWPLEKRRQLIGSAVELYQLRGTRRGLSEYLRIYTGVEPVIIEHFGGISLSKESRLGWNTVLGDGLDHCFAVILELESTSAVDLQKVKAIIEAEKPAHVAYELQIATKGDREASLGKDTSKL
jgi:phage tail-like protein